MLASSGPQPLYSVLTGLAESSPLLISVPACCNVRHWLAASLSPVTAACLLSAARTLSFCARCFLTPATWFVFSPPSLHLLLPTLPHSLPFSQLLFDTILFCPFILPAPQFLSFLCYTLFSSILHPSLCHNSPMWPDYLSPLLPTMSLVLLHCFPSPFYTSFITCHFSLTSPPCMFNLQFCPYLLL